MTDTPAHTTPRWPAWVAFVTAPWLPKTTAERTNHVSLPRALVVHLFAAGFVGVWTQWSGELSIDIYTLPVGGRLEFMRARAGHDLDRGIRYTQRHPEIVVGSAVAGTAAAAVVYIALATTLMAWGARDERLRTTFRHALRRIWLHTPHLTWAVLLGVTLLLVKEVHQMGWELAISRRANEFAEEMIGSPPPWTWGQYKAAQDRARSELGTPWWGTHRDGIHESLTAALALWVLWGLFRAVGAPRPAEKPARPPTCEWCGYNLTGASPDGKCPECGVDVHKSLGAGTKPGAPWSRRRDMSRPRALLRSIADPVLRPESFGREIRVWGDTRDHRPFLAWPLAIIFIAVLAEQHIECLVSYGWNPYGNPTALKWLYWEGPLAAVCSAAAAALAVSLAAGLLAIWHRVHHDRNLAAGFIQATSYLTAYWAFGVLIFSAIATAMLWIGIPECVRDWARPMGLRPVGGIMLGQGVLFLLWVCVYLRSVRRIGVGMRYANR